MLHLGPKPQHGRLAVNQIRQPGRQPRRGPVLGSRVAVRSRGHALDRPPARQPLPALRVRQPQLRHVPAAGIDQAVDAVPHRALARRRQLGDRRRLDHDAMLRKARCVNRNAPRPAVGKHRPVLTVGHGRMQLDRQYPILELLRLRRRKRHPRDQRVERPAHPLAPAPAARPFVNLAEDVVVLLGVKVGERGRADVVMLGGVRRTGVVNPPQRPPALPQQALLLHLPHPRTLTKLHQLARRRQVHLPHRRRPRRLDHPPVPLNRKLHLPRDHHQPRRRVRHGARIPHLNRPRRPQQPEPHAGRHHTSCEPDRFHDMALLSWSARPDHRCRGDRAPRRGPR
ncbi:MAG: hypothetical protein BWZ02_00216 [Lentisphaerae bacterium ADurb.BinA184]|nr:MAG: hypothetical protein BWZ02_00216 [Lentisphaerae bacterium ADurb.BinA184]